MKRIVFVSDEASAAHLAVAAISFLEFNRVDHLVVLTSDMRQSTFERIRRHETVAKSGAIVELYTVDPRRFAQLRTRGRFGPIHYYRYIIPSLFSDGVVIYSDIDVVFRGNITDLYGINFGKNSIAAVVNPGIHHNVAIGMDSCSRYFNAGLLVIDIKRAKEERIFERALDFAINSPKPLKFADQDALNYAVNGNFFELDPIYNFQTAHQKMMGLNRETVLMVQYTGPDKPWNLGSRHDLRKLYWNYRARTPFPLMSLREMTLRGLIKSLLPSKPVSQEIK